MQNESRSVANRPPTIRTCREGALIDHRSTRPNTLSYLVSPLGSNTRISKCLKTMGLSTRQQGLAQPNKPNLHFVFNRALPRQTCNDKTDIFAQYQQIPAGGPALLPLRCELADRFHGKTHDRHRIALGNK
jgi:hypothetical protein